MNESRELSGMELESIVGGLSKLGIKEIDVDVKGNRRVPSARPRPLAETVLVGSAAGGTCSTGTCG